MEKRATTPKRNDKIFILVCREKSRGAAKSCTENKFLVVGSPVSTDGFPEQQQLEQLLIKSELSRAAECSRAMPLSQSEERRASTVAARQSEPFHNTVALS